MFRRLFGWYFRKKVLPYWCILIADSVILFASVVFIHWVVNLHGMTSGEWKSVLLTALMYVMLSWIPARIFRTYAGVLRYSGMRDLIKLNYSSLVSAGLALVSWGVFKLCGVELLTALNPWEILVTFGISLLLMWSMRIIIKSLYETINANVYTSRALIYGALTGGVGMAKYIRTQNPQRFDLRGFISHDSRIHGMKLMDVPVYNLDDDLAEIVRRQNITAVLVSPYRVKDFRENQEIQNVLIGAGCKIYMSQEAMEAPVKDGALSDEDMSRMTIQEVSVEDLLPRQEIRVDLNSVEALLKGRRVLITGSAGSIGMEMVRQVAQFHPEKMMLIDQAETPQHDVRLMMERDFPGVPCEVVVTSISRRTRMEHIFSSFRPEYVFHAAAYKHVPMMEDNPSEAVMNNIYGTKVIADLSVAYGVKKFVMISTDKAVNPTNVMGCSKRICEIYVQSLDRKLKMEAMAAGKRGEEAEAYTQFVTTRFGNVLGSNGSVIPLFREQIKNGGPVTVTDERIVRYFMLIPEACKLVLEAGTMGNGGEIFVFDMGQPVRIADLAKRMIALANAPDIEIKYTGLREGEKLYEEVLNDKEGAKPTFHEKFRIARVREYDFGEVSRDIDDLIDISKQFDNMATVRKMKQLVPEFKSNNSVYVAIDEELKGGVR